MDNEERGITCSYSLGPDVRDAGNVSTCVVL